jgi:CHAD domain-containing protein
MGQNRVELLYKHVLYDFSEHVISCRNQLTEERLHQLRVTIKHIRAWWMLFDHVCGQCKWKHKSLEKQVAVLFEDSGKLREQQINRKLALKDSGPLLNEYVSELETDLHKLNENVYSSILDFDLIRFIMQNSRLMNCLQSLSNLEVLEFTERLIHEKFKKVKSILQGSQDSKQLHQIRKIFKTVYVLLQLLQQIDQNAQFEEDIEKMVQLNHKLGKWHDLAVYSRSLKKRFKNGKEKTAFFEQAYQKQELKREKLYKAVLDYVGDSSFSKPS